MTCFNVLDWKIPSNFRISLNFSKCNFNHRISIFALSLTNKFDQFIINLIDCKIDISTTCLCRDCEFKHRVRILFMFGFQCLSDKGIIINTDCSCSIVMKIVLIVDKKDSIISLDTVHSFSQSWGPIFAIIFPFTLPFLMTPGIS